MAPRKGSQRNKNTKKQKRVVTNYDDDDDSREDNEMQLTNMRGAKEAKESGKSKVNDDSDKAVPVLIKQKKRTEIHTEVEQQSYSNDHNTLKYTNNHKTNGSDDDVDEEEEDIMNSNIPLVLTVSHKKKNNGMSMTPLTDTNATDHMLPVDNPVITDDRTKEKKRILESILCPYEKDRPIDILTPIELSIAVSKVTTEIYPKCRLYAKPEHADNHTCLILKLLGYGGEQQGQDRSRRWAATRKVIMEQVAVLRNRMIQRYIVLARRKYSCITKQIFLHDRITNINLFCEQLQWLKME